MHTIIQQPTNARPSRLADSVHGFRQPNYDCRDQAGMLVLSVYVPGVDASRIEIEARGADLTVTARKARYVRVNWQALHLERAQQDYRLRLRLGHAFDYPAMEADISDGILTVRIPKRVAPEQEFRLRPAASVAGSRAA